jgi:hypothetical protein
MAFNQQRQTAIKRAISLTCPRRKEGFIEIIGKTRGML